MGICSRYNVEWKKQGRYRIDFRSVSKTEWKKIY